jgi:hypothetical protein
MPPPNEAWSADPLFSLVDAFWPANQAGLRSNLDDPFDGRWSLPGAYEIAAWPPTRSRLSWAGQHYLSHKVLIRCDNMERQAWAASSDNYATLRGKRCVKSGL